MDIKTWEKIREECKKAHPIARIRKLHPIIHNPNIPKKIRDEAGELAAKARLELDQEHFWKWGSGISLIPTSRAPQLEEEVREGPPAKRSLEETVENSAARTQKNNDISQGKYTSGTGDKYLSQGYFSKTAYERESKPEETREGSKEDVLATTSEKLTKVKYHR